MAAMLAVEAVRLREILLGRARVAQLLNLGSSTRAFRTVEKPHIEQELFAPLGRAGIAVFHSDRKPADGVDLAGDVLDPAVKRALGARQFGCVLIGNLLEHVRERDAVAAACEDIVGPGGLILATVPRSYPYHADPLDTGYRPSPDQLAGLFRRSEPLLAEELAGPNYREDWQGRGSSLAGELARTLRALLLGPVRPRSFASHAHRWLWHDRPYRVSIALLKVR